MNQRISALLIGLTLLMGILWLSAGAVDARRPATGSVSVPATYTPPALPPCCDYPTPEPMPEQHYPYPAPGPRLPLIIGYPEPYPVH